MTLDIQRITNVLAAHENVMLAMLFGSSRDGEVREDSDVDIGVLLVPQPTPMDFYSFYQELAAELPEIDRLDLVDLGRANSILAFEALCGRRLVVRDPETVAGFASLTARQYEDDMSHAA